MGAQRRPFSAPIHSCFWRATHQCSGIESTRSSVKFCSDCQSTFSFMFSQIVTPIVTSLRTFSTLPRLVTDSHHSWLYRCWHRRPYHHPRHAIHHASSSASPMLLGVLPQAPPVPRDIPRR